MLIFIFISVLYHYNCSNLTRTILSYLDYSDFYMPVYYFIFLCPKIRKQSQWQSQLQ